MEEIRRYTIRGMQVFIDCISRRQKRELRDLTISVRMSQDHGGKAFDEYVKKLEQEE